MYRVSIYSININIAIANSINLKARIVGHINLSWKTSTDNCHRSKSEFKGSRVSNINPNSNFAGQHKLQLQINKKKNTNIKYLFAKLKQTNKSVENCRKMAVVNSDGYWSQGILFQLFLPNNSKSPMINDELDLCLV